MKHNILDVFCRFCSMIVVGVVLIIANSTGYAETTGLNMDADFYQNHNPKQSTLFMNPPSFDNALGVNIKDVMSDLNIDHGIVISEDEAGGLQDITKRSQEEREIIEKLRAKKAPRQIILLPPSYTQKRLEKLKKEVARMLNGGEYEEKLNTNINDESSDAWLRNAGDMVIDEKIVPKKKITNVNMNGMIKELPSRKGKKGSGYRSKKLKEGKQGGKGSNGSKHNKTKKTGWTKGKKEGYIEFHKKHPTKNKKTIDYFKNNLGLYCHYDEKKDIVVFERIKIVFLDDHVSKKNSHSRKKRKTNLEQMCDKPFVGGIASSSHFKPYGSGSITKENEKHRVHAEQISALSKEDKKRGSFSIKKNHLILLSSFLKLYDSFDNLLRITKPQGKKEVILKIDVKAYVDFLEDENVFPCAGTILKTQEAIGDIHELFPNEIVDQLTAETGGLYYFFSEEQIRHIIFAEFVYKKVSKKTIKCYLSKKAKAILSNGKKEFEGLKITKYVGDNEAKDAIYQELNKLILKDHSELCVKDCYEGCSESGWNIYSVTDDDGSNIEDIYIAVLHFVDATLAAEYASVLTDDLGFPAQSALDEKSEDKPAIMVLINLKEKSLEDYSDKIKKAVARLRIYFER